MNEGLLPTLLPWLALLAAWPLLYALSVGLTALQLMRLRLRSIIWAPAQRQQRPPAEQALLHDAAPALTALGFSLQGGLSGPPLNPHLPDTTHYSELYRASDGRTWALLSRSEQPEATQLCTVQWLSCFDDGHNWLSVNHRQHLLLPPPARWTFWDAPQPSLRDAWHAHVQRLAQAPAAAVTDAAEVSRRYRALLADLVPQLADRGAAVPAGPGLWRLRAGTALRLAWRLLRNQSHHARAHAAQASAAATTADTARAARAPAPAGLRLQADLLAFATQQSLQAAMRQQRRHARTFWLSAALFWLLGAWWLSWQAASMLLLILAVHEGGHWLLMRLFGFAHLSVFFIPGLGAATMGEKAQATPLEKVLVYLAGPMPGIVLALAAAVALNGLDPWPSWLHLLLLTSLAVNGFNLLPLMPLDGGRVVDVLLFARLPALRLVFALGGLAAFAALAWWLREPVIILVTAWLALGLPWQWRAMRLERAVRRAGPAAALDEAAATQRLFAVLQQPAFARWSFAQRSTAVRSMLPSLQGRPPRWGETAAGLLLYLACLTLPWAAIAYGTPHTWARLWQGLPLNAQISAQINAQAERQQRLRIEAELARAHTLAPDARARLYLRAASVLLDADSETESDADIDADTAPSAAERQRWLLRLLHDAGSLPQPPKPVRALLAQALQALATSPPEGTPAAQRLRWLQQAAEHRRVLGPPAHWALVEVRLQLARALDSAGHPGAALAQLQANVAALREAAQARASAGAGAPSPHWRQAQLTQAETELAWFHIAHGQPQAAWTLGESAWARLQAAQGSGNDLDSGYARFAQDLAAQAQLWAAVLQGDADRIRSAWSRLPAQHETPLLALNALAAATAADDARWQAQALARLRALQAAQSPLLQAELYALCQPAPRTQALPHWREPALALRARTVRAFSLCPASAH